jgi:hypothetical protein
MAKLTISPTASATLKQLPPDKTLLMAIWRHLQQVADDPDAHTEPAPFPYRQDRRLCAFRASDTSGREWAFSALFAVSDDEVTLTVIHYNADAGDYPGDDT